MCVCVCVCVCVSARAHAQVCVSVCVYVCIRASIQIHFFLGWYDNAYDTSTIHVELTCVVDPNRQTRS